MSRIFNVLLNLRIGTKLAVTSALSIVLVAAMIVSQMFGNLAVRDENQAAINQQSIAALAADTRAANRGMQIGVRDIRLARTAEDLQRSAEYLATRHASLTKYADDMLKVAKDPQNRARMEQLKVSAGKYVEGAKAIQAIKAEAIGLEAKQPIDAARVAELNNQVAQIARERTLPIANELEETAGKIAEVAKARTETAIAKAEHEMASAERINLGIGIGAALLLIGACVFSVFTIARPMKALTGGMLELADGNFDVVLPGLGRKDEIGDVAGAVETFKVKSAEKARLEAEAKAELDRKAIADKAERDRIEAEQKAEAEKRAQAEREAATAKVMNEFDAAVGGIVKAAMQGDFSQRVPLEGKEGVIRNLAGALNTMCEDIGKVMDDMVAMMSSLAEGDLTQRIQAQYQGTFGTLKDSANTTAERLAHTVSGIKSAAAEVSNAAAEISTSTTDLSQRTEEQAAGLEQTSASMEEIAATVKKNAENAQEANTLTGGARDVADKGGQVVANAVQAMSRIEESSRKISDIIGVIDEIARQTNLLALNAAVEAARAGDAGRGFAVVASEVRSLAQRSSQAAKDIKDLITNSNSQVQKGVELVNQAGTSLNEIVESIKSVANIVADIANASTEQSTGIEQVNKALTQMDEVTQQNSALVEENAATAKTLETQSGAMNQRVSFFRLEQGAAGVHAVKSEPKPEPKSEAKPVPVAKPIAPRPTAAPRRAAGGPVGRMQSQIATAIKQDHDWEEF